MENDNSNNQDHNTPKTGYNHKDDDNRKQPSSHPRTWFIHH